MIRSVLMIALFVTLVVGVASAAMFKPTSTYAAPLFRVIDVRAEYGHLIVEVQHFHPNGSHWFYENYTFQGREQYRRPRVTDEGGRLFLKRTGREAPKRAVGRDGVARHYLPPGREWLRHNRPHLDRHAILGVIREIHDSRVTSGWDRGVKRLTTHRLDGSTRDWAGARRLAARFARMKARAFRADDSGILLAYTGPLPAYRSAYIVHMGNR